jgi:DNA-binding SARP family transcriptional activator
MARWSFRFLGPFVAERSGAPLRGFRSDKVRALLAFLAVQPDRPWPRGTLADLLWADQTERTARANLRNALSNLHRVLGDAPGTHPLLTQSDTTVTASAAADRWIDVEAFLGLLPTADATAEAATEPATLERLAGALALMRGEFLQGFALDSPPFETWLTHTREQLRCEATRAARLLAQAQALVGNDVAAEAAATRWLDLEPWDEAGHRHLMRLLLRQGRRSAALVQYETCRRRLTEDLSIEPETATTELADAIRAGSLEAEAADPTAPAWPGLSTAPPPKPAPFVARERELTTLSAALANAATASGAAFFVTGEPGSGKTALMAEFARRALADDPQLLALWGSCSAFTEHGDPFEPFRHAAQMLTGEAEAPPAARASGAETARRLWRRLPASVAALLDHGPDLVDRFISGRSLLAFARRHGGVSAELLRRLEPSRHGAGPSAARPGLQAALFAQLTAVLGSLAQHRPLLLLLDDLQWIDPASIDLLFHLARELGGRRFLLLGAYRAEEAGRPTSGEGRHLLDVVEELLARDGSGRIDLTGGAGRGFVDALLDLEPNELSDDFRTRLHGLTSGNPLFTIELLRGMQLRGELRRNPRGRWTARPDLDWGALPARVEAVIARRVGHLSPKCAELLLAGSVEGEAFTAAVAAAVAGQPLADACDLLSREAGRQHRLVTATTSLDIDGRRVARYRFRHGLFQAFLYQRLDEVELARLHAEVACHLLETFPPDPERRPEGAIVLARHFEAAGLLDEAIDHYAGAARHAARLSANAEAVAHLRTALRLLSALPATPARDRRELGLQLALGPPLTAAKGWAPPELEAAYARVQELLATLEDDAQLVTALWPLTVFRIGRSEHAQVDGLAERMERLAQRSGDPALIALTLLRVSPFYQGRFAQARRGFEAASARLDLTLQRELAQRFGMAPAAVGLAYLAECLWVLGLPEAAAERGREALELVERVDHPMTTGYVLGRACWLAATRRDAGSTRRFARDLGRTAETHGLGAFRLAATFFRHQSGVRDATTDDDASCLRPMRDAIDAYRAAGTALNRPAFLTFYAAACGAAGQVESGLAAVREALTEGTLSGETWFQAETWRVAGDLLDTHDAGAGGDAARTCHERARRVARRQGAVAFEQRARARA